MSICGRIYKDLLVDCNFSASSVSDILYIINLDDILFVKFEDYDTELYGRYVPNHKSISEIQLKAGASLYTFVGKRNSLEPGYYMFDLIYSDSFAHYIDFRVFEYDADVKSQLEKLGIGRFVAIIETYHSGSIQREVFGINSGLELIEMNRVVADIENSGSYFLSLETPSLLAEPHLPNIFTGDITSIGAVCWILATGFWNDGCTWFDTSTWID